MLRMPHSKKWQQILSVSYGDQKAGVLISRAQTSYERYYVQHATERNRANRAVLRTRVLPGLSIYKALLEENDDQGKVLVEIDGLFRVAFFPRMVQGIRVLKYLPDPFFIVRPVLRMMTREAYMPGSQETVEDNTDCFAVNVYRCFILDILTEYNAEELTVLYCNTDDWMAEAMPKISWERTKTLGRGDEYCDFRWRHIR